MDNNIFKKRLESLGIARQVDAAVIVAKAQEVINRELGTRGSDNLRVVSYSKGILKIAATSGAWAAECRKIETELKKEPVKKIYYITSSFLWVE